MRYYNEVRSERRIRFKALALTTLVLTMAIGSFVLVADERAQEFLPDVVKEWFQGEESPQKATPKKKSKRA